MNHIIVPVISLDVFFISYDEPNCEKHWADLQNVCHWAQRVHGVKGFDAAHKECARLSTTEFFITIDGDNVVYPEFFNSTLSIPLMENGMPKIVCWRSLNYVNGMMYGNGGVKCWPKSQALSMQTHENAVDPLFDLDFCWADNYSQNETCYSTTYVNGSPYQAFRAGFREGCKMTAQDGKLINLTNYEEAIPSGNLKRLLTWVSVGADVENGIYAILGALDGVWYANLSTESDIRNIRDYDWMAVYFSAKYGSMTHDEIQETITQLAQLIRRRSGLPICAFDKTQSELVKFLIEGVY